jgi:hypothetical protein
MYNRHVDSNARKWLKKRKLDKIIRIIFILILAVVLLKLNDLVFDKVHIIV